MSTEENKAVVQRFWDEWNKGNIRGMADLLDDNAVDHSPPPGFASTKEGTINSIGMYFEAFPGVQGKTEAVIAEGDKVASHMTFSGTNKGSFMGMPATGKSASINAIHIFRVANGKLVEHWSNQDDLGLLQQIGVIPTPGQ